MMKDKVKVWYARYLIRRLEKNRLYLNKFKEYIKQDTKQLNKVLKQIPQVKFDEISKEYIK